MKSSLRSLVRRARPGAREDLHSLVRWAAAKSASRKWLNLLYRSLARTRAEPLYQEFAKIFRDAHGAVEPGEWTVDCLGQRVRLPLKADRFWLDWDQALSLLGHEPEIKETYASFINSPHRPDLFVDVGANYGLHSLLFLVHGVRTVSFEPNPSCHGYFEEVCALNGVTPHLERVALGDEAGFLDLCYPERETWLGSTEPQVVHRLDARGDLVTRRVEQRTLDDYVDELDAARVLVKIDTEGHEHRILQGAQRVLKRRRPFVIFECWPDGERSEVFDLLAGLDYRISRLPFDRDRPGRFLGRTEFIGDPDADFVAVPGELSDGAPGAARLLP